MQSGCLSVLPDLGTPWFILAKVSKIPRSCRLISKGDGGGAPSPSSWCGCRTSRRWWGGHGRSRQQEKLRALASSAVGHNPTGDWASLTLLPTKIVYLNTTGYELAIYYFYHFCLPLVVLF